MINADLLHCVKMTTLQLKLHLEKQKLTGSQIWWVGGCGELVRGKNWHASTYEWARCRDEAPNCHSITVQVVCIECPPSEHYTRNWHRRIYGVQSCPANVKKKREAYPWTHSWPTSPSSVLEIVGCFTVKTAIWSLLQISQVWHIIWWPISAQIWGHTVIAKKHVNRSSKLL